MAKSTEPSRETQAPGPPGGYDHRDPEARTELRLKLLANGYVPLPNEGKPCYLKGWPRVTVTESLVLSWARRYSPTTGLRLDNLVAFDLDTVAPHTDWLRSMVEETAGKTPLERVGNRARSMLIYRWDDRGFSYMSSDPFFDGPD